MVNKIFVIIISYPECVLNVPLLLNLSMLLGNWFAGSSGGLGSSGGSLVVTPDCKLQSWVQIQQSPQPTVDCQSLDGLPSGMALCCRLSSKGRQRSIYKKHQKQLRKKKGNWFAIFCCSLYLCLPLPVSAATCLFVVFQPFYVQTFE